IAKDGDSLVLTFPNGTSKVPLTSVQDYVIEGAPAPEPVTDEEKAQAAKGLVRFNGKWMKPEERDKALKEYVDQRRKELEEAKAHAQWRDRYKFDSKDFKFESTMPKALNDYYSGLLDAYFEYFKKDWNITIAKGWDAKLPVCFYPTEEEFH